MINQSVLERRFGKLLLEVTFLESEVIRLSEENKKLQNQIPKEDVKKDNVVKENPSGTE